ncbi:MAG: hypothetical protein HQK57_00450 [Deltaproteobacteria bacterium]|nr:hypothetical protein [Deltaproteobacteria bacterium]
MVILIDDVDTAFQRGWRVLETVRKYLVTPHLIVIVSGDLELYEMVIRLNFIEQAQVLRFVKGNHIPDDNTKCLNDFGRQYQLKLLPLENRIHLPSTYENLIAQGNGRKVEVRENTRDDPKESKNLAHLFSQFCKIIYGYYPIHEDDALSVNNPLTSLFDVSSREFVRLVDMALWPCIDMEPLKEYNGQTKGVAYGQLGGQGIDKIKRRVFTILVDLHKSLLKEERIDPSLLSQGFDQPIERELFLSFISSWGHTNSDENPVVKPDEFDGETYLFRTLPQKHNKNKVLLTIQAVLNTAYARRIDRIIDYWLLFADMYMSCSDKRGLSKGKRGSSEDKRGPSRDKRGSSEDKRGSSEFDLGEYLGYLQYESTWLPHICSLKVAWEHNQSPAPNSVGSRIGAGYMSILRNDNYRFQLLGMETHLSSHGTFPWLDFLRQTDEEKSIKGDHIGMYQTCIPTLYDFRRRADEFSNAILDIFAFNVTDNRGSYPYVSFYRGLAILGEIIRTLNNLSVRHAGNEEDAKEKDQLIQILLKELTRWRQQRYYPGPKREERGKVYDSDEPVLIEDFKDQGFFERLLFWLRSPLHEVPPVQVLGTIWRHTFRNTQAQFDELTYTSAYESVKRWSVGEMLRWSTLAFLNAILVFELEWKFYAQRGRKGWNINIDFDNVKIKKPTISENNLRFVEEYNVDTFPFFKHWASCPLLWLLLSPEDQKVLKTRNVVLDTSDVVLTSKQPITWKADKNINKSSNPIHIRDNKGDYSLYTLLCSLGPTPPIAKTASERDNGEVFGKRNLIDFFPGTKGSTGEDDKQQGVQSE